METRPDLRNSVLSQVQELSKRWGWLLAFGILLVIVGILALAAPFVATAAGVAFIGFMLLLGGIFELILAFTSRRWRGFSLHLLVGILGGMVGLMMLIHPGYGAAAITLLLALLFLGGGIVRIVDALAERFPNWGLSLAAGIVSALLGIFVLAAWPVSSILLIGVVIGVELLVRGATWITMAFVVQRVSHDLRGAAEAGMPS